MVTLSLESKAVDEAFSQLSAARKPSEPPNSPAQLTKNRLFTHRGFVDVHHKEVAKLEELGYTQLLYSLISTFCREYLGPSLKKWSPRFFGDGALNLELLAKRRSELWILLKDDIGVVHKGGQRQVVTRSDVQVVTVGGGQSPPASQPGKPNPRLLHIVDEHDSTGLRGLYIRLPDSAFAAYGDLLPE